MLFAAQGSALFILALNDCLASFASPKTQDSYSREMVPGHAFPAEVEKRLFR